MGQMPEKVIIMGNDRQKQAFKHVIMVIVLLVLTFSHYFFWVKIVDPTPEMDGFYQYYSPVLDYLKAAPVVGNDPVFLCGRCFSFNYPYGLVLVSWLVAGLGLGDMVLSQPYILNIICILPFLFCCLFFRGRVIERFLIGLIIFFFPLTQICIKQFSVSGLTTAYSLLALLFFRSWLLYKRKGLLFGFAFSFWFAAITKHLGLIFLFNFIIVYALWAWFNGKFEKKIFLIVLSIFAGSLPFYSFDGFKNYLQNSFFHNSYIAKNPYSGITMFVLTTILILILPFIRKKISKKADKTGLPKFFRNGFALFLLSIFFFHIMVSNQFSVFTVGFYGYGFFLPLFFRYNFFGPRGFIYLYTIFTIVPILMLYYSDVGRAPHVIFLPVFLMLVQTISENRSWFFRVVLLVVFLIFSNFFPDYKAWGGRVRNIYDVVFRTSAHNPLGWSRYGFGSLKKEFIRELEKYNFSVQPLFLVENMDNFIKNHLLYMHSHQHIYAIPHLRFLERLKSGEEILREYEEKGTVFFDELFEKGSIPVLIYMNDMSSDTSNAYMPKFSSGSPFNLFNNDLIRYFRESGRIYRDYNCVSLPKVRPMLNLCIAKNLELLDTESQIDYGGPGNLDDVLQAKIIEIMSDYRTLCTQKKFEKAGLSLLKASALAKGNKKAEQTVAGIKLELQGFCE